MPPAAILGKDGSIQRALPPCKFVQFAKGKPRKKRLTNPAEKHTIELAEIWGSRAFPQRRFKPIFGLSARLFFDVFLEKSGQNIFYGKWQVNKMDASSNGSTKPGGRSVKSENERTDPHLCGVRSVA